MTLYNEIDEYASQWLQNLIDSGQISPGRVETKSITELDQIDLIGFDRVHLFAGIGGWEYALKLADWPQELPVWTGSCPCQPFSGAGKKKGVEDERHLWPEMFRLIKACNPPIVFGEQVAGSSGIDWMHTVQADLQAHGYEVAALDICAAGFHAPHIRQRIFWAAVSTEWLGKIPSGERWRGRDKGDSERRIRKIQAARLRTVIGMADTSEQGSQRHPRNGIGKPESRWEPQGQDGLVATQSVPDGTNQNNPWSKPDWIGCRDNKFRPVESGSSPLAHGIPRGMGKGRTRQQRMAISSARTYRTGSLKGYGNAIVPQVAAWFVRNVLEWIGLRRGNYELQTQLPLRQRSR